MYRELAKEYAQNLLFAMGGIGAGVGIHRLLQSFDAPASVPYLLPVATCVGTAILVGASMALFLSGLKKVVVEDLTPAFREDRVDGDRGLV
jgi:hypothetical protein